MIASKSDSDIQQDVLQELRWDTRVKETDVGVEVDRGIVTLTGTVDSWAARVAAEEAAHCVGGVLDVANDIHVKPRGSSERTDTDIARAVREALTWDVLVPDTKIKTTVSNGNVLLTGTVELWSERAAAASAIRNLAGVRSIRNDLIVSPPHVPPGDVRRAISDALSRHAAHAAKHVDIDVQGGAVKLSGHVASWAERQAAEGAARGTRGVKTVENHIHVGN